MAALPASAEWGNSFTVAETDPCYNSLEAYKQYISPLLDDYWHVRAYRAHADKLAQWEQCCPGGKETGERLRFEKAIPADPKDLPLPPVFADFHKRVVCQSDSLDVRQAWFYNYNQDRERHWRKAYEDSTQALYDCCVDQFKACLEGVGRPDGTAPTSADSERCLQRFSPEHQQQTAVGRGDGQAAPSGFAVIAGWPEGTGSFELGLLTAAAALVGFICGRAGRRRWWARFGARMINALFAVLVFLGIVALLPDTQSRSLLLALAGAIIITLLRLLIRSFFLLRQREQDAPVP